MSVFRVFGLRFWSVSLHNVEIALRRVRSLARALKPWILIGDVIHYLDHRLQVALESRC
jgi:hypothetical protein